MIHIISYQVTIINKFSSNSPSSLGLKFLAICWRIIYHNSTIYQRPQKLRWRSRIRSPLMTNVRFCLAVFVFCVSAPTIHEKILLGITRILICYVPVCIVTRLQTVKHLIKYHPMLVHPYKFPNWRVRKFSSTPLHRASMNGHM